MKNIINSTIEFFKYGKNERIARYMVRANFPGHNVTFTKEKNRTTRFYVGLTGVQGFYRVRTKKLRPIAGDCFDSFSQVHCGPITIAVEAPKGRSLWNFSASAEQ